MTIRKNKGTPVFQNGTISYEKIQGAKWLARTLKAGIFVPNNYFFDCLEWITGDLRPLLSDVINTIKEKPKSKDKNYALENLHDAQKWSKDRLTRDFNDILDDCPYIIETVRMLAFELCERISKSSTYNRDSCAKSRRQLKKFFALDSLSLELFEFVHFLKINNPLDYYFDSALEIWRTDRRNILACTLNAKIFEVEKKISELIACGIMDINYGNGCRIESDIVQLWDMPDNRDTSKMFFTVLKGETLPLENFRISDEDLCYIKNLLTSKSNAPVNIMLYGPLGTGKTTFARSLSRYLGLKAWAVTNGYNRGRESRRAALVACLNVARKQKNSFVLVDEAELMLNTGFLGNQDKGWLNNLLETPGNRIIWITNYVSHISPAVRRRFSFSVYFANLGKQEQFTMWSEIINRHKAAKYFTQEQIQKLTDNYDVPAAVMKTAITQAKILPYHEKDFFKNVECSLRAYKTFINNGESEKQKIEVPENFTQDGITLQGSLDDLIERCKIVDAAMKNKKLDRGCATMLFYGPPGTGKTALARYIAHMLRRDCIVKRASDILNCFLGNTEKNIAQAFYQAEKDNAVLVIDEADTFLFSRDNALRSWETSQVNEFLTNLEECRCFCICTTNRLDELDAAAIRRFSYKVAFTWAGPEQILVLYNTLLAPLCGCKITPENEKELRALTRLTPGDFHAVRSQYNLFFSDNANITHETIISSLQREEAMKSKYAKRTAGF